jgi:hypothetical protein
MRSTIASWLNILQNHARQKQAELAQTPPQRRRTSNVAHARSWRASTRRSRTWRASSEHPITCRIDLFGPVSNRTILTQLQVASCGRNQEKKRVLRVFLPQSYLTRRRSRRSLTVFYSVYFCGDGVGGSAYSIWPYCIVPHRGRPCRRESTPRRC